MVVLLRALPRVSSEAPAAFLHCCREDSGFRESRVVLEAGGHGPGEGEGAGCGQSYRAEGFCNLSTAARASRNPGARSSAFSWASIAAAAFPLASSARPSA